MQGQKDSMLRFVTMPEDHRGFKQSCGALVAVRFPCDALCDLPKSPESF